MDAKIIPSMFGSGPYLLSPTVLLHKLFTVVDTLCTCRRLHPFHAGASSDLETATKIARLMVTKFGMTETVREYDMHGKLACYERVYIILRLF